MATTTSTTNSQAQPEGKKEDKYAPLASQYIKNAVAIARTASDNLLAQIHRGAKPFAPSSSVLDLGCGTGCVSQALIEGYSTHLAPGESRLVAVDNAPAMLNVFRQTQSQGEAGGDSQAAGLWKSVEVVEGDATDLSSPFPGEGQVFSHVLAGFLFFGVPQWQKAVRESHRLLKPGGVLGFTSFTTSDWMEGALQVDFVPSRKEKGESLDTIPDAWKTTAGIKAALEAEGFKDVHMEESTAESPVQSLQDYFDSFMVNIPHLAVVLKALSDEERKEAHERIFAYLRKQMPTDPGALRARLVVGYARK